MSAARPGWLFRTVPLLGVLAAAVSHDAWAEDWPQFRGPRGDGTWHASRLPETWPADGLRPRWKQPIGGGYAGISVVGNRGYTLDRQLTPEECERVLCFDTLTGETLWEHRTPVTYGQLDYGNGPRAQPTIAGGRVYSVGALGHVSCLDAATGSVIWRRHYVDDFGGRVPMWGFAASPVVVPEGVLLAPGGPQAGLVLLNAATGEVIWRSLGDEAGYATPTLTKVVSTPVIVHWTPSHVRGIALHDGMPLWAVSYPVTYGVSIAKPIVSGDVVFVAGYWEGSRAIRLGKIPAHAELMWEENRELRGLMSQPLVRDGFVYLLDKQYGLTCFELATGKKRWDDDNALTPRGRNPHASIVAIAGTDRVIALNAEGELVQARVTPDGYHELSRASIIGFTWAHPAFADDHIYARSDTELVSVRLVP